MADFECTCSVEKGERAAAWGEDCYCWYPKPNYNERIVRCRDCKSCVDHGDYDENLPYCNEHIRRVKPDCFCSWAKPKGE